MGQMRAAKLENSKRLQRALLLLADGKEHTTRDIVKGAEVMAVNSCICELREGGWRITCKSPRKGIFEYQLDAAQAKDALRVLLLIDATKAIA